MIGLHDEDLFDRLESLAYASAGGSALRPHRIVLREICDAVKYLGFDTQTLVDLYDLGNEVLDSGRVCDGCRKVLTGLVNEVWWRLIDSGTYLHPLDVTHRIPARLTKARRTVWVSWDDESDDEWDD